MRRSHYFWTADSGLISRRSAIRNPQSKMSSAPAGIRTPNQQIMLTTSAFAASLFVELWSGLSLRFTRLPLSLYTFHACRHGLARDYHSAFAGKASPNLTDSTNVPETNLTVLRV